ncbi:MAG TPA: general stress protein [Candidatus Baltobacteraceae bacterium]|nr:general stress protein [Candidatus Baltobacteraceae bacterium]
MDAKYEAASYDTYDEAEAAVNRLAALGYGKTEISVIVGDPPHASKRMGGTGVGIGAATGGLLGAILAAAAGGTAVLATGGAAIPFVIGPLAGLLAGGAAGAGIGGVAGGLMQLGLQSDDWDEKLHSGGMVVAVALKNERDREGVRTALLG